jgi:hypothetical protein
MHESDMGRRIPNMENFHLKTAGNCWNPAYPFPKQRKQPMTDASHVRDAMALFDPDRDQAFANIQEAAKHYKIEMKEKQDFGKRPQMHHTARTS